MWTGKKWLLFLFVMSLLTWLSHAVRAQDYAATKATSLSGAAEVVTVQQPAATAATVRFVGVSIDCTVACTYTIERNGTAASSTTLTTVALLAGSAASKALAWSSSNVGTGTVIYRGQIAAGGGQTIPLSGVVLSGVGTTKNVTIRTNSITGDVKINFRWTEAQ